MIVRKLRLHPFAGARDRTVELTDGLSVVLGPNEAGKSTLFHALAHALLTTTDLTPAAFNSLIGQFLPIGGGDTIRVSLEFTAGGIDYSMEKQWTRGNRKGRSTLRAAKGAEFTDPSQVDEQLSVLLPSGVASVREVLLTGQAALAPPSDRLDPGEEVRSELGDLLRQAVAETGGISVERFRTLLEERHTTLFRNWDAAAARPAGGREIDNPHRRNVGTILAQYYGLSALEEKRRRSVKLETEIDRLNEQIRDAQLSIGGKESERSQLQPLRDEVRRRAELTGELRALRAENTADQKATREWPVKEEELHRLKRELEEAQKRLPVLDRERAEAERAAAAADLLRRLRAIELLKAEADRASAALAALTPVTGEDVERHRRLAVEATSLRALLDASKLTYAVRARRELQARVSEGVEQQKRLDLAPGSEQRGEANGRLEIALPDLTLAVWAGGREEGSGIEDAARRLPKLEAESAALLSRAGASDAADLAEKARGYALAKQDAVTAQNRLSGELGDDDLESLLERTEQARNAKPGRALADVASERAETAARVGTLEADIRRLEADLDRYREQHGSHDALVVAVGRRAARIEELEQALDTLPELPDRFESADDFFAALDTLDEELQTERERMGRLREERTRMESAMPEESSEQLGAAASEARSRFERAMREGRAVEAVRRTADEILEELDRETFGPYEQRFVEYLSRVSGGRFTSAHIEQAVPESFSSAGGDPLPYGLLSWGTRDLVALALRLVLAEFILGGSGGFLVLDDPLVDMDPDRRRSAAEAIRVFAGRYQTILFTCHPNHAEELGATTIRL